MGSRGKDKEEELGENVKPAPQRRMTALLMDTELGRGCDMLDRESRNTGVPERHKDNWIREHMSCHDQRQWPKWSAGTQVSQVKHIGIRKVA